jgi:hypothetical protein
MPESGKEKLLSLLFGEGRELVNIKFFPGTDRGLTSDQLCGEAESMLRAAMNGNLVDNPPLSGRRKTSIKDENPAA